MKFAIVLLALCAAALAEHEDKPSIPHMPDLSQIKLPNGMKVPEIPAGMKIEDLKDAFYNLPPAMKDRLNEMAQSFGMQLDDVEEALNNPPEKLKEYFDKNSKPAPEGATKPAPEGAAKPAPKNVEGLDINNLLKNVDLGAMGNMLKGMDIEGMMKNIDLGAMGNLMKNVDIGGIMKGMDMGAMANMMNGVDIGGLMKGMDMGAMANMMKNVDIEGLMKNIDMGAMAGIMKNVDIGGMMKNMDLGAMGDIVKNVDVEKIMKNVDMGAIADMAKKVDIGGMMKDMDLGAMSDMVKKVDIAGLMKNVDVGAMTDMMKNVDIGGIMKNVDMGSLMKNFDLGSITGLLKNIDIGSLMKTAGPMMAAMKGLNLGPVADIMSTIAPMTDMLRGFDIKGAIDMVKEKPIDLERLINLKDAAWDFLEQKGVPMDDPVAFVNFVHQKVKDLHLPADLDLTPIFNVLHGQLEAMGMPEDKTKIKQWLMDMAGLSGIKDIEELKDPEVLTQVAIKKAFRMMGLDENSDPQQVVDRVHEQLIDEAKKVGASINKDASPEDVMKEMDKVLTKRLNDVFGMDAESAMPDELHRALTNKLQEHGFPVHDFGAMKKHVMDIVMKELVKTVTPMIMNLFMGGSAQPPHPPMMPPMMPPHIPINLAVSVNVEGPAAPQIVQMPVPRYLHGAEPALEHKDLDDMDDQSVYDHIMVVRQALMSGEMPEEILQEMIEDLMNARLKSRVLAVRNMFLADRLAAMEHEMDAMNMQMSRMRMQPRLAAPSRQMVPRRQAPRRNADFRQESTSVRQSPLLSLLSPRSL